MSKVTIDTTNAQPVTVVIRRNNTDVVTKLTIPAEMVYIIDIDDTMDITLHTS